MEKGKISHDVAMQKLRRNMKYLELNRIENMFLKFDREVEKYLKGMIKKVICNNL